MARGRGGSERMFTTAKRRAASVPVDLSGPNISTYLRAQDITSAAMDNTDDMRKASRRQDQRLLDNITSTLASGAFNQPVSVIRSSPSSHRRASVASLNRFAHKRHAAVYMQEDDIPLPETSRVFRNARLRAHGVRASSVPPIPTYAETAPPAMKSHIYSSYIPSSRGRTKERYYGIDLDSPLFRTAGGGSSSMRALRMEAPLYVGRAYQLKPAKRSTYESWYRAGSEPPPLYTTTANLGASRRPAYLDRNTSLAMKEARSCLGRIERELGVENGPSFNRYGGYDSSYAIEAPIAAPIIVPTRVTRAGSSRTGALPPRRYSISGPPSSIHGNYRSHTPLTSRLTDIEARLDSKMSLENDFARPPSMSLTQLRSKTTEARNMMDRHRTMLDRYLPIHMGPENEVEYEVAYKFGELAERVGRCAQKYLIPERDAERSSARPRATHAIMTSGRGYRGLRGHANDVVSEIVYHRRHRGYRSNPLLAIAY